MSEQVGPEGYAFPVAPGDVPYWQPGMTLRDYFAGQALARAIDHSWGIEATVTQNAQTAATWAYEIADAMLKARAAKEGKGDE